MGDMPSSIEALAAHNTRGNPEDIGNGSAPTWGQPVPFTDVALPSFPTDVLPSSLAAFVRAEAAATQTQEELLHRLPSLGVVLCTAA